MKRNSELTYIYKSFVGRMSLATKLRMLMLFAAAYNDILRVPGTSLSLFRIMLIPYSGYLFLRSIRKENVRYAGVLLLLVLNLQQAYYYLFFDPHAVFSLSRYAQYALLYISIIAIFCITRELLASIGFDALLRYLVFIAVTKYIAFLILYRSFYSNDQPITLDNMNNYGASFAALVPVFLYLGESNHGYQLLIPFVIAFLYHYDCKLALIGVIVSAVCFGFLKVATERSRLKRLALLPSLIGLIVVVIALANSNITINGYVLNGIIREPLEHIISMDPYPMSNTSVSFRANTIIYASKGITSMRLFGIGFGNGGIYLRNVLANKHLSDSMIASSAIAMHNFVLEFLLEFGWIAVLAYCLVIREGMIRLRTRAVKQPLSIVYISSLVASPFVLIGPSGILTCYLVQVLYFAFFIECHIKRKHRVFRIPS